MGVRPKQGLPKNLVGWLLAQHQVEAALEYGVRPGSGGEAQGHHAGIPRYFLSCVLQQEPLHLWRTHMGASTEWVPGSHSSNQARTRQENSPTPKMFGLFFFSSPIFRI